MMAGLSLLNILVFAFFATRYKCKKASWNSLPLACKGNNNLEVFLLEMLIVRETVLYVLLKNKLCCPRLYNMFIL
jgi:hypothetical protein